MGLFRKGAGTLGWAGDVTTQRRNLAVDQLQKQRQGNYRYKLKIVATTRELDGFLADLEQGGNLRQHSSSMLLNLTPATHRQQP